MEQGKVILIPASSDTILRKNMEARLQAWYNDCRRFLCLAGMRSDVQESGLELHQLMLSRILLACREADIGIM